MFACKIDTKKVKRISLRTYKLIFHCTLKHFKDSEYGYEKYASKFWVGKNDAIFRFLEKKNNKIKLFMWGHGFFFLFFIM